ncbi:MAG: 50S ribosomal protein L5 [bacterium]|nr:50S ribosomal protein L5 [bacterium]
MSTSKKEWLTGLQKKLNIKNINAVPKLDKVVVAVGIGSLVTRKGHKNFEEIENNLQIITGQKPRLIKSKQAISNFKLRADMPVMLQVTLRREKAYAFLDRLAKLVLPRVRDFEGLEHKKFDQHANYNMGLKSYDIFPEIDLDKVTIPMGLQITIIPTTNTQKEAQALLEALGFVFVEEKK